MSSFSNLSVTSPTSQLILQPFHRFTYVTVHCMIFSRGKQEKPREKPTETLIRPPRNPHGVTGTRTRSLSCETRASGNHNLAKYVFILSATVPWLVCKVLIFSPSSEATHGSHIREIPSSIPVADQFDYVFFFWVSHSPEVNTGLECHL